jgi:hypothetical protein
MKFTFMLKPLPVPAVWMELWKLPTLKQALDNRSGPQQLHRTLGQVPLATAYKDGDLQHVSQSQRLQLHLYRESLSGAQTATTQTACCSTINSSNSNKYVIEIYVIVFPCYWNWLPTAALSWKMVSLFGKNIWIIRCTFTRPVHLLPCGNLAMKGNNGTNKILYQYCCPNHHRTSPVFHCWDPTRHSGL